MCTVQRKVFTGKKHLDLDMTSESVWWDMKNKTEELADDKEHTQTDK